MPVRKYDALEANKVEMEGAVNIYKKVPIGRKEGWNGYIIRTFTIGPGGHSPRHSHDWEHVNYVIQVKGRLMIDGRKQDVDEPKELGQVLIQKIYEVDPLTCPKCSGAMRVISVIEDEQVIEKILKYLGLWEVKARPPPKKQIGVNETVIDYSQSQLLPSDDYLYVDPAPACV